MARPADPTVASTFKTYPEQQRKHLLAIREMIFEIAAAAPDIGPIEETLKWGQPSYRTPVSKSGTTIRLAPFDETRAGVFFHCGTNLVDSFRQLFPDELDYSKNRAIVLDPAKRLPKKALRLCLGMALTYHASKRRKAKA